jgi:hypothetical protein
MISHRFEHQADWFAVRHMAESLAQEPEVLADTITFENYLAGAGFPEGDAAIPGGGMAGWPALTPAQQLAQGAEIFGSSLRQLVELSHRGLAKRGWLHPSVRERVALLERLAGSPGAAAAFARMQWRVRWGIAVFLVVALAVAAGAGVLVPTS